MEVLVKEKCNRCGSNTKIRENIRNKDVGQETGIVIKYCLMCGRNAGDYPMSRYAEIIDA